MTFCTIYHLLATQWHKSFPAAPIQASRVCQSFASMVLVMAEDTFKGCRSMTHGTLARIRPSAGGCFGNSCCMPGNLCTTVCSWDKNVTIPRGSFCWQRILIAAIKTHLSMRSLAHLRGVLKHPIHLALSVLSGGCFYLVEGHPLSSRHPCS